jgi:hypothetical protein
MDKDTLSFQNIWIALHYSSALRTRHDGAHAHLSAKGARKYKKQKLARDAKGRTRTGTFSAPGPRVGPPTGKVPDASRIVPAANVEGCTAETEHRNTHNGGGRGEKDKAPAGNLFTGRSSAHPEGAARRSGCAAGPLHSWGPPVGGLRPKRFSRDAPPTSPVRGAGRTKDSRPRVAASARARGGRIRTPGDLWELVLATLHGPPRRPIRNILVLVPSSYIKAFFLENLIVNRRCRRTKLIYVDLLLVLLPLPLKIILARWQMVLVYCFTVYIFLGR